MVIALPSPPSNVEVDLDFLPDLIFLNTTAGGLGTEISDPETK